MDKKKLVLDDVEDYDVESAKEVHRIIMVPSSLCYSVFTTLCCCAPLGIAAMVMSLLSHDAVARGKHEKASSRARLSRKMSHLALFFGLVVLVISVVLMFAYGYMIWSIMQGQQMQDARMQVPRIQDLPVQSQYGDLEGGQALQNGYSLN